MAGCWVVDEAAAVVGDVVVVWAVSVDACAVVVVAGALALVVSAGLINWRG